MSEHDSTRPCTVYGLSSSRDGEIRYIGQTALSVQARLGFHKWSAKKPKTPVAKWIAQELALGYHIRIEPIEEDASLDEAEIRWIAFHREQGAMLLNSTDGGKCGPLTPAAAAKVSAALKGRTPKNLASLHANQKGKTPSPETRAKIAKTLKEKPVTPELIERLKRAKQFVRNFSRSDATRRKISDANKGVKLQLSDEEKARRRERIKAVTAKPEVRRKISESQKGKKKSPESIAKRTANRRYGEEWTDERRIKQSEIVKALWAKRKSTTHVVN